MPQLPSDPAQPPVAARPVEAAAPPDAPPEPAVPGPGPEAPANPPEPAPAGALTALPGAPPEVAASTSPSPEPEPEPHEPASPSPTGPDGQPEAPALVTLEGVTCDFGEGAGVFDVDLTVRPGTILGVVGPSGAGKTTTIRLITGALDATKGRVRVMGEDPRHFRRATRERIGYMPQLFALYSDLTARENVDFVASLFGLLWPRRRRRVREVLRLVELDAVRNRRAGRLSGGMQRRLELACALVHEPSLLLLDEPTAGIDPILRQTVWDELARLKRAGRTILVTTQYVAEAESCDAVALIAGGRLVALGAPEELRRRAAGGDVVEAETDAPFDPAVLVGQAGIVAARSIGLRAFRVVVDDAGTAIPVLDDLVEAAGGHLTAAREARLSFDEVFTVLVEQAGRDADAADARREDAA